MDPTWSNRLLNLSLRRSEFLDGKQIYFHDNRLGLEVTMVGPYFAVGSLYTRNSSKSFISPDEWGSDESWNFRLIRRANDGVVCSRFTAYGDMSSPKTTSPLFPLYIIYTIMDARTTDWQISAETVGWSIWRGMTKNSICYMQKIYSIFNIYRVRLNIYYRYVYISILKKNSLMIQSSSTGTFRISLNTIIFIFLLR